MKCVRFVMLSLLLVLLSGMFSGLLAAVKAPGKALSEKQIVQLVSGKTIVLEESSGKSSEVFFFNDGELRLVKPDKDYLKGFWNVREDRLCMKVSGDRDCRFVLPEKNSYRLYIPKADNNHEPGAYFASIRTGNAILPQLTSRLNEGVTLPAGTLNAEEVLQLFYDRTVESVTAVKRRESRSYYDPDGEVSQYRNGQKRTGKWQVKENGRICLQMEDRPGKCRIIVREAGEYKKYIVKKNGRHVHSVSYPEFRKGNPYHL
ncbi:MAG: hypothetical protein C0623_02510 [Desulfuromonas sp.]|nr:MAG: hypothetical protein C0623_02510 [Desulfuromonas sp.]